MADRDRNKQGLVYGPVRSQGPRDRGRIVGQFLGFVVVVITAGVLGFAVYILLTQSPPPAPAVTAPAAVIGSPSASPPASESPGTSTIPTTLVLTSVPPTTFAPFTSAPQTTPLPTPATPGPTLYVPQVEQGPGFVTFGTTGDSSYHVTDPTTTFAVDEPMVWSADLLQPANSSDLQILVYIQDPTQASGERLLITDPVTPDVQDVRIFFRHARPFGQSYGPGVYTVQYVRGTDVLSQGSFLVQ